MDRSIQPTKRRHHGRAVGSGVAIDYLWDKSREGLDRPAFEAANAEALDGTIQEWSRAQRDLFGAIDVWFDDTRSVVVEHKIRRKPPIERPGRDRVTSPRDRRLKFA